MNVDRAIRRIRNSGVLFHENETYADKASRILGKLLDKRAKMRYDKPRKVGPYSGLLGQNWPQVERVNRIGIEKQERK